MPELHEEKKKLENVQEVIEVKNEELYQPQDIMRTSTLISAHDQSIKEEKIFEDNIGEVNQKNIEKVALQGELPKPKYVGIDEKYSRIEQDDSERMINVRNALAAYHDAVREKSNNTLQKVKDLIKACDAYTYMRFSLFRGERGKQRLKEVRELREQAKVLKIREEAKLHTGGNEANVNEDLWRIYKTDEYYSLSQDIRKERREDNKRRKVDREKLREKDKYTLEKLNKDRQDNDTRYILGMQKIRSIKDAIDEVIPGAYNGVDKSLTDQEAEKREMDLVHAEGTKWLNQGHDVIEFDVAGSSFDQFRKEHEGVTGINKFDGDNAKLIYNEKLDEKGYLWKSEREVLTGSLKEQRYAKKTKYSIAGPAGLNMNGLSDYSIQATRKRIRDMGVQHLTNIFNKWNDELKNGREPKYYKVDLVFKGHSRGGVGASQGAMMLKYWLQTNYPEYVEYVNFHLTQYDPVPGWDVESSTADDMGRYDVKEYQGVNKGEFTIEGEKMAPLGAQSDTTVLYSMVNQDDWMHKALFAPQEVLHAKRLILMPFTHDIGMDLQHIDTSQMKSDQNEKAHSMAFINATDNKVYRSSGLNELDEGVYVMDEHHVMVKVDSLAQLKNILMRTMPDTYEERRARILRAAASIFGDRAQMDEYASVDHQRNLNLAKSIENDSAGSKFRKPVQDILRDLRALLGKKPGEDDISQILETYQEAIDLCSVYIEKRDEAKATEKGRKRLEDIKEMHSALIREKRHFYQKAVFEIEDVSGFRSWNEIFMTQVQIKREESDVKESHDVTMGRIHRVEHSGSVAFFKEMGKNEAKSAAALSQFTESAGFTGLFRAAQEAKINAKEGQPEMEGIVYEQTFDLSYTEVMSKDYEYSRHAPVKIEKAAQEKIDRILAFDLLFGITERLKGDLTTLRVSLQRHQDKNTKEIAKNGDLQDIKDTYSINDVCADLLESPLFSNRLSADLTRSEQEALYSLSDTGKKQLKKLEASEIAEMAGTTLSEEQVKILFSRLASMKALI